MATASRHHLHPTPESRCPFHRSERICARVAIEEIAQSADVEDLPNKRRWSTQHQRTASSRQERLSVHDRADGCRADELGSTQVDDDRAFVQGDRLGEGRYEEVLRGDVMLAFKPED